MKYTIPVILGLFTILVVLLVNEFFAPALRDSFFVSFLATLMGMIIGIPVALGINDHQNRIQDKKKKRIQDDRKKEMLTKVLTTISMELVLNRNILLAVIEKQDESPQFSTYLGLRNETWKAMSDSGDLTWIDDPRLIDNISYAHYFIRRVIFFEDRFFDPNFNMGVISTNGNGKQRIAGQRSLDGALAIRKDGAESIDNALFEIDKILETKHSNQSIEAIVTTPVD